MLFLKSPLTFKFLEPMVISLCNLTRLLTRISHRGHYSLPNAPSSFGFKCGFTGLSLPSGGTSSVSIDASSPSPMILLVAEPQGSASGYPPSSQWQWLLPDTQCKILKFSCADLQLQQPLLTWEASHDYFTQTCLGAFTLGRS